MDTEERHLAHGRSRCALLQTHAAFSLGAMFRVRAQMSVAFILLGLWPGGLTLALEYERDVMPIFASKCFECHSVREGKTKGGLRLDDLEHFRGRFAENELVTPGNPKLSGLYYSLTRPRYQNGAMPPEGKGDQLTAEEVERVRAWIADGANVGKGSGSGRKITDKKSGKTQQAIPTPFTPVVREWSNREGKTIRASLLGVEGNLAILRLPNGTVYRYPIAQLSDTSQALLPAPASVPKNSR